MEIFIIFTKIFSKKNLNFLSLFNHKKTIFKKVLGFRETNVYMA